jgi:hypothetical protein
MRGLSGAHNCCCRGPGLGGDDGDFPEPSASRPRLSTRGFPAECVRKARCCLSGLSYRRCRRWLLYGNGASSSLDRGRASQALWQSREVRRRGSLPSPPPQRSETLLDPLRRDAPRARGQGRDRCHSGLSWPECIGPCSGSSAAQSQASSAVLASPCQTPENAVARE